MLEILYIGIILLAVIYSCYKGRKLRWYEMMILLLGLFIFTEKLNCYYTEGEIINNEIYKNKT